MVKYDSFRAMKNSPEGFGKALYNTIREKVTIPHSYKDMELSEEAVYGALWGVLANYVPNIKSLRAMQTTSLKGGIEEELYLAASQIKVDDYELVINKVSELIGDSTTQYPNVHAVNEALKLKADKIHSHNISDVTNLQANINNKELIGNKLTSHDINVPLLKGEVIINRLEPQTILVDVGVLWVDCRKIRLKTTVDLVWVLTATPTPEEPNKKTWVKYTGQSMFVQYDGDTPIIPEPSEYSVGSILVDHKPLTMETFADIYIISLQDDDTTHYWKKLSSQDGYIKDPTKPSINGVNIAGARTGQSYKLQDQLEAGVNIKKIKVGDGEPQSLLDNPRQPLVVDGGGGGTSDYNSLVNLPVINEKVLKGRLTSTDLDIPLTAEIGDCIIARNETYNPMLNINTIWLDIFKLMKYDPAAAKILDWKEMGSKEKVWIDYDKTVHYEERYDPEYIPHDIPDEQEGDLCVVYNPNYVPVFWKVFKLDKVGGLLTWRRVNLIYSYSQIPDKPILNGHRIAGDKDLDHYGIQGKLVDVATETEEKNTAQLIVDGKKQSIFQSNDIVIDTIKPVNYIISLEKQDPDDYPEGFYWITYEKIGESSGWTNYVCSEFGAGRKTWTRFRDPFIAHVIPSISVVEDGQLLVLTPPEEDVEPDSEVYKAVKNETVQEWVRLFGTTSYTTLYDKPILNGKTIEGDKGLKDYGIQAELIGSGEGQNIKTINGQSLIGSGNIEIKGGNNPQAVIAFESLNPEDYEAGTIWLTGTEEQLTHPEKKINVMTHSGKSWSDDGFVNVYLELPSMSDDVPDGVIIVVSDFGKLFVDAPVYKADKSDASNPKWVRLDVPVQWTYDELPDKPQIEGHELTGNKTADELGLATKEYVDNIQDTIIIPKKEKLPDVYQNYAVIGSADGKTPRTAVRTRVESYPLCPDGGTIMWMDDHYAPANDEINKNMTLLMNPATQRTLEFKEFSTVMFKVAAHKKFTIKGVNFKLHDGTKYFFNELVVDNTTDNVINIDERYIEEHYEPVLMAASDVLSANNYEEYIILPDGEAEKIGDDTTDYNELEEETLPQLNGNMLKGNKSSADLGLASSDAVETLENELENVKKNVATDFYKTSTIKAPSCKAIVDYIDTVLAELDGSEEEF